MNECDWLKVRVWRYICLLFKSVCARESPQGASGLGRVDHLRVQVVWLKVDHFRVQVVWVKVDRIVK